MKWLKSYLKKQIVNKTQIGTYNLHVAYKIFMRVMLLGWGSGIPWTGGGRHENFSGRIKVTDLTSWQILTAAWNTKFRAILKTVKTQTKTPSDFIIF